MRIEVEGLAVEATDAESERFAAGLLLVHGLWAGGWVWTRLAGYLAHRGWASWALDLRGRPQSRPVARPGRITLADYAADCAGVAAAMPAPPVVIGHDLGATVALLAAAAVAAPAVVLVAPLLPQRGDLGPVLGGLGRAARGLLGRPLPPPAGAALALYAEGAWAGGEAGPGALAARLVADSGRAALDLLHGRASMPAPGCLPPVLMVGGTRDRVMPPPALRAAAHEIGAECVMLEGGHWLPIEERWQATADAVHRWVVQTLGAPLLLLREEEAEGGPGDDP